MWTTPYEAPTKAEMFSFLSSAVLWVVLMTTQKTVGALRLPSLPVPSALLGALTKPPAQQPAQQPAPPLPPRPFLVESLYKRSVEMKDVAPYAAVTAVTLVACLLSVSATPLWTVLSAEGAFFAFCSVIASTKFNPPIPHEDLPSDRPFLELWGNIFSSLGSPEHVQDFFASWFFDVPFDRIRREDAQSFIAWALYTTTEDLLDAAQRATCEEIIARIEYETTPTSVRETQQGKAQRFAPRAAHEATLPSMRHSIEPLRWVPKPGALYLATQFFMHTINVRKTLTAKGFTRRTAGKLTYWIHPGTAAAATMEQQTVPLLFFHGIGGLFVYIPFVDGLRQAISCPIALVELPYVSLHVALDVPSIEEHVSAVEHILLDNGCQRAILVGHSFGTNVMSWLVQSVPGKVAGSIWLDPVCFMLHLKDVTKSWFR